MSWSADIGQTRFMVARIDRLKGKHVRSMGVYHSANQPCLDSLIGCFFDFDCLRWRLFCFLFSFWPFKKQKARKKIENQKQEKKGFGFLICC
jgi:hypothetical protein